MYNTHHVQCAHAKQNNLDFSLYLTASLFANITCEAAEAVIKPYSLHLKMKVFKSRPTINFTYF